MRTGVQMAIALAAFALTIAPPAGAHTGSGRAQLYVPTARLEPQAQAWTLTAVLRDLDSGAPQPGFAMKASGRGPSGEQFGPLSLADLDKDGRYQGHVPLVPGRWALTLEAREVPGGQPGLPFTKTWDLTLQPGQPLDLGGEAPRRPGSSESDFIPNLLAPAAGAAGAGLAATWLVRRRRQKLTSSISSVST